MTNMLCEWLLDAIVGLMVLCVIGAGLALILFLIGYVGEALDNFVAKCRTRREYRKHVEQQHVQHDLHEDADDDPPMNQNSRFSS